MSARATPQRPSSSLHTIVSPPSSEGPSRRSTPRTRGAGHRRASNMSSILPSTPSSSAATRARRLPVREVKDDQDWAAMDPDDVFRHLPVLEVKRVEAKMRADALNKQSELRSMVGTRYRDLLTSASQITALHESSLRLSNGLRSVVAACSNPADMTGGDNESEQADGEEDVGTMLPVAAHVKLLLDAPEALYSFLAHHAYLNAAFLWLVGRVVKEGLQAMPEDVKGPYVQLLQKQWEVLVPFRAQIVQRATAALRTRDKLDPQSVSDTLLAIILLDSLPMPEALDLLLSQRLKALRDILAHAPEPKENTRRARRGSKVETAAAVREVAHQRDAIGKVIAEAVKCLLDAEGLVRGVFEPKRKVTGDGESVLGEAIRLVQQGEELPATTQAPTPIRRTSQKRRTSRLTSISLALPPRVGSATGGPPVSTHRVLQTLPSSQILLRYLPQAITAFTPFITPSAAPNLADKLGPWQASAVELLRESLPVWLDGLHSVSDVWSVRSRLRSTLNQSAFETQIAEALETEWGARVQSIWTAKLDALVSSADVQLQRAGERIRAGEETDDNDPEAHIFGDITFPSTASGSHSSAAFDAFLETLRKRSAYRTSLLDAVLGVLEHAAADLKADLAGLPESLYSDYKSRLGSALDALVHALNGVLAAVGGHRDATGSVEAELFVGRVALYLVHTSPFLSDLTGSTGHDLDNTKSALMDIHASSTIQWRGSAIARATNMLLPLFDSHRGPAQVRASWQAEAPSAASPQVLSALEHLTVAVRRLGVPPGVKLDVVPRLVKEFVAGARDLDGWDVQAESDDGAAQAALDLAFLAAVAGGDNATQAIVQKYLGKLPASLETYKGGLEGTVTEALRRTQVVLFPLTAHLPPTVPEVLPGSRGAEALRTAALLRLGAPALATGRGTGVGSEFKSPVAVAKPGRRFPLLSIVA